MRNTRHRPGITDGFGTLALLFLGIVGIGIVVGIFFVQLSKQTPLSRYTAVITGNPFLVVSWNRLDDSIVAISIPATVRINGAYGYGMYSLEALYKLDMLDKRNGALLLTSLSDALGYPIDAYLDMSTGKRLLTNDIRSDFKDVWSFPHVVNSILGQRGSLPPITFYGLVKTAMSVRDEKLQTFDFERIPGVIREEQLPDQTMAETLDADRVADVVTGVFEDIDIRQERLRVAIFNTTSMQGIGQKAAKLLSTMGMFIVSVTNDSTQRSTCLIRTKKEAEQSKTVRVIQQLFRCSTQITQEPLRSDVDVYIGYDFTARYEPFQKE